ncbi:unnamed protein product [Linum trigynum]|uniref:Peptidase A1 domain-containing protein n=1 Tax=Linum trigynum TaxID=586398 RepID=A0AAV2GUP0_9ROSI
MLSSLPHLLLTVAVVFFSSMPTETNPVPIVAKLTHRDAVSSPFYREWETESQRQDRLDRISAARVALLSSGGENTQHYPSHLLLNDDGPGILFVNFSIGSPPAPLLVFMDTGSSLSWVICQNKPTPTPGFYDRFRSATFQYVSCNDPMCEGLPKHSCLTRTDWCVYDQSYQEGPRVSGFLATEEVVFQNSTLGMTLPVDGVVFGCTFQFLSNFGPRFAGILGLGPRPESLVRKIGPVFSYCLGNVRDENYRHHHLVLNDEVDTSRSITISEASLDFGPDTHYYIRLTSIRMPGQEDIIMTSPTMLLLDSGTKKSLFPDFVYETFVKKLDDMVRSINPGIIRLYTNVTSLGDLEDLCYKAELEDFRSNALRVTLYFDDGDGWLEWEYDSIFYQVRARKVCSSISPSSARGRGGLFLIGLLGQQNQKFTYDLDEMRLYIEKDPDCAAVAM